MKASAFKVDLDFSAFDESFDQDVDENDPELLVIDFADGRKN